MALSAFYPFRSALARQEYLDFYDRRAQEWPLESETRTVETSYGQTFLRISGAPDAPPLVLLPGRTANSLMWIPNIRALAAEYRAYALDSIFDLGRSTPTRRLRSPRDFVSWLDELFTALGLKNGIRLVGMSYGGWQAALYALRFPGRLASVVMIAPAATVLPLGFGLYLRGFLAMLHPRFYRSLGYWMFADSARFGEAARRRLAAEMMERRAMIRRLKVHFAVGVVPTVLKDADLGRLKPPALFVVGEHEKLYSALRAVRRLRSRAPQVKVEVIPQAGHDLLSVQAELVNGKVLAFLKQSLPQAAVAEVTGEG